MRLIHRRRRALAVWLAALFVASQIAVLFASPIPVQAKTLETSSDPSDEIVYIDADGVIRVLDPQGDPLVEWFSPSGGWRTVALLDVNNDGDMEIAAMGQNGDNVKIAFFDPVVARGATDPNKKINGIPWDTLYETEFPGVGTAIIAGDFDVNVPGDELAILYRDGRDRYYLRIWKASDRDADGNPTGRAWEEHIRRDWDDVKYSTGTSGQLNGEGADELILIDEHSTLSRVDVFIVDRDMERMDGKSSDNDIYRQAITGQPIAGGKEELGLRLSVDRADKRSTIVYEVNGDNELKAKGDWQWAFAPQGRYIFFADIFGNGDDEFFILRDHPNENGARLIMRDDWGDDRRRYDDDYDVPLQGENYKRGAGGDIDGDGKDEIVLLRRDRITILHRPDDRPNDPAFITVYEAPNDIPMTDDSTLVLGNLDAIGFIEGPTFGVSQSMFEVAVPTGTQSGSYSFSVENISTLDPVTFNISVSPGTDWLLLDRTIATTPATVSMRFNATNLSVGHYEATLTLQSGQPVLNQPYEIKVVLDVLPAVIAPRPQTAAFIHYPCTAGSEPGASSMTVRLGGTAGLTFRGAVIGVPGETVAASADVFNGQITGGEVDENGNMVLYDANGNTRVIETGQVSAAAALTTTWHIDDAVSSWVKNVYSEDSQIPTDLTIEVDLSTLGANFPDEQAIFVMVADTRAGDPPDNVSGLPIVALCAKHQLAFPAVR